MIYCPHLSVVATAVVFHLMLGLGKCILFYCGIRFQSRKEI